jgi:hypothetical protein
MHQSKRKLCVCVLGVVALLLRFSASGWADIRTIPLSFLSFIVVLVLLLGIFFAKGRGVLVVGERANSALYRLSCLLLRLGICRP